MDQVNQYFYFPLFEVGEFRFTVGHLVSILLVVFTTFFINFLIKSHLIRGKFGKKIPVGDDKRATFLWITRTLVYLIGLVIILSILGIRKIFTVSENAITVFDLLKIVALIIAARTGSWYVKRILNRLAENRKVSLDKGRRIAISQIFSYMIWVLAVLLILTSLKIQMNVLIASAAGLSVGIGLALQHVVEDVASGIIILVDGTIEVGDMVVINSLQLEGKVEEIRLRSTVVETFDAITVIVPNSRLTTTNVVNWSFNDKETRFNVTVGVAYGSDLQLVRKVLASCAVSHGRIMKKPEPRVRFTNFGDSSLDFELLFWTKHEAEIYDIQSDLRFKIDAEFRRHNISIPFPQRDLHIVSAPPREIEGDLAGEETGRKASEKK
ncbi:MAG: mechanosensitive ion channel domain-containing protein [Bacteroidota bacterium]